MICLLTAENGVQKPLHVLVGIVLLEGAIATITAIAHLAVTIILRAFSIVTFRLELHFIDHSSERW